MAGFDAGSLVSKLKLDKSGWNTSVSGVEKDTKKMGGFMTRNGAKMKKMGTTMTVAGAAIVGSVGLMIKKFVDAGDEIDKMSKRTGFSATALSELAHAADISGADLGSLEKGVKKMSKTIVDASSGLQTYVRSFERVGIEVKDLQGLNPEEQFLAIADAIGEVEDPTIRAATAQEIFGRAGTQLLPMFAEGKEGMKKLREEAHTLGIVFDEEAAAKAAKLKDEQTRLSGAMKGLSFTLASTLVPVLSELVTKVTGVITKVVAWTKEHPKLSATIMKVVAGLGGMLAVFGPILIILPNIVGGLKILIIALTGVLGKVMLVATAFTVGWKVGKWISKVTGFGKALTDKLVKPLEAVSQASMDNDTAMMKLKTTYDLTRTELASLGKEYGDYKAALKAVNDGQKTGIEKIDEYKEAVKETVPEIKDYWSEMDTAAEKTKTLAEELSLTLRIDLEGKLEKYRAALEKYKDEGQLTAETEADLNQKIHETQLALDRQYDSTKKVSSLIGGMFTPSIVDAMKKLSSFKDEGEAAEWQILNIAKAANTTALAVKIAIHNMQANMAAMAGIYIPRISTAFLTSDGKIRESSRTTSKEVKSTWDQLTDGIQTKMASTWSAMLQGTTSFKDGFNGIINAIKSNFFDMIGSMIAKWTVNFIGSIVSSSASAATSITSKLGGAIDKIGEAATAAGSGLGASIVALAQGIATAAKIIASSAKEILIAAAVALAVYAGFSAIKKLFGAGGGKAMDATNRELHNIWIEARNSWQELMLIRDMSKEMMNSAWSSLDVAGITNSLLTTMADYLKTIAEALTRKGTIYVDVMRAQPIEEAVQKLGVITEKSLSGVQSSISEMSTKKIIGEILGPGGLRPTGLIGRKLVPEITGPGGIRGGGLIGRKLVPEILGPGGIQPGIEPKRRRRRIFEPFIPPPEPRFEKNWGVLLKRMAGYLKTIAETLTGKKLKPSGLIGRKLVPEILGPGGIQPGGLTIGGEIPEILGPGLRRRKRGEPGGGEAKQVIIKIDMINRFDISTLDPRSMRRIVHQEILPLIIESFDRPRIKTKIKEKMGI